MTKWKGGPARYAHVKLDGHYLQVTVSESGYVTCTSKQGTALDLTFVPSLKGCWTMPCGKTALGELWYPGKPASYIKTAIKERDPQLRFSVFAMTGLHNDELGTLHLECSLRGLHMTPWYGPEGSNMYYSCVGIWDGVNLPPLQHEGFVLKDGVWTNWQKYKPFDTIDLIVEGLVDGKNSNLGLVGSLICRTAEGYIVANAGGFKWEDRVNLSEDDIGRVVEVKYQLEGSKGKLRHPTFVRFRDDKLAHECTVDQDEELENYYKKT
jgi:hypothetical protein